MEGVDVLVLWRINEMERITQGPYSFVKTITVLNQPWTLNISSVNPAPGHVLLKRPSCNKVKVTGSLEMAYPDCIQGVNDPSTKRFVKILEANQKEVDLPIHSKLVRSLYNMVPYGPVRSSIEIRGYFNISETTYGKLQLKALAQLSNDFCCLLKEQASVFTDVTLACQDIVIPAHRTILSARSPVFAAMFRNEMKETLDGTVCVEDIDPKIFKMMLSYVYSGRTDELTPETAGQLLFAADKYQLEGLKEICSDCLKADLCLKNAFGVLVLGDLHDGNLKSAVMNFICKSVEFSQVESSEEWKSMQREKPQLAMEVLSSLVKFYASKK